MTDSAIEQDAHDINNLLARVIWTAQAMRDEGDRSVDDRRDLAEIVDAGREAATRVEAIVERSRRCSSVRAPNV